MALRSIEIICAPCVKCADAERRIKQAIKGLELMNKAKYAYDFKKTADLRRISQYSAGVITPLIIINGTLEFSGKLPALEIIRNKLESIIRF